MRSHTRPLVAAVAAGLVLAIAASTASAGRLRVSPTDLRIIWPSLTFASAGGGLTCPVTMTGSFHSSTIAKTTNLIGHVTSAAAGTCQDADHSMVFLDETLPWHLSYHGFTGTLPLILTLLVRMGGVSVQVSGEGIFCLFNTTSEPLRTYWELSTRTGQLGGSLFEEGNEIDLDDEFLCGVGGDGTFVGAARITSTSGALVFLRLI